MLRLIPVLIVFALTGCAEASFDLSSESRLPKWFELPKGLERSEVTVSLTTYIVPTEKSVFVFKTRNGDVLSEVVAHRLGGYLYPKELDSSVNGYPSYEILVHEDVIDVIEHRKMEPFFFVSDEDAVWSELGLER